MMPSKECQSFFQDVENWAEGRRSPVFARHLAHCNFCAGLLADLESIRNAARELDRLSPEPPLQWKPLETRLREDGLIRTPRWNWPRILPAFPARPVFSAVYAAVLFVAFFLVTSQVSSLKQSPWEQGSEIASNAYDAQLRTMERETLQSMPQPNTEMTKVFRSDLSMIDNYIVLCKRSVREQPQSELARDYLNDAYLQKANLLASMVERGANLQ